MKHTHTHMHTHTYDPDLVLVGCHRLGRGSTSRARGIQLRAEVLHFLGQQRLLRICLRDDLGLLSLQAAVTGMCEYGFVL